MSSLQSEPDRWNERRRYDEDRVVVAGVVPHCSYSRLPARQQLERPLVERNAYPRPAVRARLGLGPILRGLVETERPTQDNLRLRPRQDAEHERLLPDDWHPDCAVVDCTVLRLPPHRFVIDAFCAWEGAARWYSR